MSKKYLVKQVIDRLIKEGEDFCDLTQGYLSERDELEGVSKTTIKRAKNEYKQQNTAVKNNYKEQRIKKRIYKFLDRSPKATLGDLREEFPNITPPKVSEYHLYWKRKQEKNRKKDQKDFSAITPRKLKEMVFKYLDENPYTTAEQLASNFMEANKSSVNNYFNHWKKKQLVNKESVKKGSLVQVLFDYLDKNTASTINDLQQAFTDVHKRSLEIYFSLWKKKYQEIEVTIVETIKQEVLQLAEKSNGIEEETNPDAVVITPTSDPEISAKKPLAENEVLKIQLSPEHETKSDDGIQKIEIHQTKPKRKGRAKKKLDIRKVKTESNSEGIDASVNDTEVLDHDLILSLESTIEAQMVMIDALNFEQHVLKQKKRTLLYSSLDVSDKELAEVKNFLALYLEGYKRQKTDIF